MSRHVEKLGFVHTKCQYQVTVLGTDPVLEIGTIFLHLNGRNQARRKRCGMAAVAAPKICREREREREREKGGKKKKIEEKEKRERGEKGKKGRGEQERKMYFAYGCKAPP